MSVRAVLLDARKALGALAVGEAAAASAGLLGGATAGYVTAGLGVASAVVVYLLRNVPKPEAADGGTSIPFDLKTRDDASRQLQILREAAKKAAGGLAQNQAAARATVEAYAKLPDEVKTDVEKTDDKPKP